MHERDARGAVELMGKMPMPRLGSDRGAREISFRIQVDRKRRDRPPTVAKAMVDTLGATGRVTHAPRTVRSRTHRCGGPSGPALPTIPVALPLNAKWGRFRRRRSEIAVHP